jgi:shikimate 5-dehydrogenase
VQKTGLFVYQGVIGFERWTGRKAPEAVMVRALRSALEIE